MSSLARCKLPTNGSLLTGRSKRTQRKSLKRSKRERRPRSDAGGSEGKSKHMPLPAAHLLRSHNHDISTDQSHRHLRRSCRRHHYRLREHDQHRSPPFMGSTYDHGPRFVHPTVNVRSQAAPNSSILALTSLRRYKSPPSGLDPARLPPHELSAPQGHNFAFMRTWAIWTRPYTPKSKPLSCNSNEYPAGV